MVSLSLHFTTTKTPHKLRLSAALCVNRRNFDSCGHVVLRVNSIKYSRRLVLDLIDALQICEKSNSKNDWYSFDISSSGDRIVALGAPHDSDGEDPEMWLFFAGNSTATRLDDPNKPSTKISLMDLPPGNIAWADNGIDVLMEELSPGIYWRFKVDSTNWSIVGCESVGVKVSTSEASRLKELSKACHEAKYRRK